MSQDKINKIKQEIESMDDDFWNEKINNMVKSDEYFKLYPTKENEANKEIAKIDFAIHEARYNGYKEILREPGKMNEVAVKAKELIDEFTKERQEWEKILW